MSGRVLALLAVLTLAGCGGEGSARGASTATEEPAGAGVVALWNRGLPAFGIYVPDERAAGDGARGEGPRPAPVYTRAGGAALAANPLYDFLFLNLEGAYDPEAVREISAGVADAPIGPRPTLLVRIPPISAEGEEIARARVREILDAGADGVVLPHIRGVDEARTAIGFFAEADVWSPTHPEGQVIAMLMLEDADAVADAPAIADLGGYSVLACGIGSLTRALGGDREAAEAGNQRVLAEARRAGLADMITANAESIEGRIREGFLALLLQGPTAEDIIRQGRSAAGR
ncbi:MAG: aldolase/citrate lyase family protein [Gemmatimonadota bacterium]